MDQEKDPKKEAEAAPQEAGALETALDGEGVPAKAGKGKKLVLFASFAFLLVATAVGGIFFFKSGKKPPKAPEAAHAEQKKPETHAKGEKSEKSADGKEVTEVHADSAEGHKAPAKKFSVVDAVKSVHKTAVVLSRADLENQRLHSENANLRRWIEEIRFDCKKLDAEKETRKTSLKLSAETGARLGVVLSSISYRPPSHLMPAQLYTLGVSYFRGNEFEKAAVIFSFLTGLDEDKTYMTLDNYLVTGVAWYRVSHFKLAEEYFDKVLAGGAEPGSGKYLAQAQLWKAIVAQRTEQYKLAQKRMLTLVDQHPESQESRWINPQGEVVRSLASDSEEKTHGGQDNHESH